MKKIYALFIAAVFCMGTVRLNAQCGQDNIFTGQTVLLTGPSTSQTINYASGQYALFFLEAGVNYTVSTCGTSGFDTQLTINYQDDNSFVAYNDDYCGLQSTVNFTAPKCGNVLVALDQYFCNNSGLSHDVTFTQNTVVTPSITLASITSVFCAEDSTGAVNIDVTPCMAHLTYLWSNGDTTQDISGLLPGTYIVTVTDDFANMATDTFTVNPSAFPVITHSVASANVSCNGGFNGTATVTAGGGMGPFTYAWSPSGDTLAITDSLMAGSYAITVTDSVGCAKTDVVVITEPVILSVTDSTTNVSCNGGANGAAAITTTGGTAPYTYAWMPSGGTTTAISGVTTGTYTVTVTDSNGCNVSDSITISEPAALTAASSAGTIACNGAQATVTVAAMGGVTPYSGTGMFMAAAGTQTYTVTDTNGCSASTTITLTEPSAITGSQSPSICSGDSIMVGTNTYMAAGMYSDTLAAFNGCDSVVTTTLTVNTVDVTTSTTGNVIMATLASATYQWLDCDSAYSQITGETNQSFTALMNGNFAVMITSSGCMDTSACVNISSTGISSVQSGSWNIYPNPSNGMFTIVVPDAAAGVISISITDIRGSEVLSVKEKNAGGNYNKQMDLGGLAKGIYYIRLNTGEEVKIKKLVIN
jgi:hypothetical protein